MQLLKKAWSAVLTLCGFIFPVMMTLFILSLIIQDRFLEAAGWVVCLVMMGVVTELRLIRQVLSKPKVTIEQGPVKIPND